MDHPVKDIKHVIRSLTQGSPEEQATTVSKYFAKGASFTHPFCRVPSFKDRKIPLTNITNLDSRAAIIAIYRWYKTLSPRTSLSINSVSFDQKTNTLYVRLTQDFSIWFIPFHNARHVELVSVLTLEPRSAGSSSSSQQSRPQHSQSDGTATNLLVEPLPHHKTSSEASTDGETLYDAASETRHLIQEGEKPSFSEVAAGEASTTTSSPITGQHGGQGGQGNVKYYITHQEDLYQVTEFLKFITLTPGSLVYTAWQLCSTIFCVLGAVILAPMIDILFEVVGFGKQKGRELSQEGREVVGQGRQVVNGVMGDAKQVVNGVVGDAKGMVNGVVGEAGNWILEEVMGLKEQMGKAGERAGERMKEQGERMKQHGERMKQHGERVVKAEI
ncbi:hypothetical protein B0T21DRAFT_334049 [Apiosordaria backusii]|uniref:SigF-like NTF2-like domain-containing protein n=1 Tax=Apiosordaria backusii TaxID=314023 RepID=A0AA40BK47_9PEZI|nr:hypothetical protein B0T21DRAFT_334049 [Apiosordaria backusii]